MARAVEPITAMTLGNMRLRRRRLSNWSKQSVHRDLTGNQPVGLISASNGAGPSLGTAIPSHSGKICTLGENQLSCTRYPSLVREPTCPRSRAFFGKCRMALPHAPVVAVPSALVGSATTGAGSAGDRLGESPCGWR
jgi:hypothetical protein